MTFWTKAAGKAESISPEAKGENGRERWRDGGGGGGRGGGAGVVGYITLCGAPYHLHGLYSPRKAPAMQMSHKVENRETLEPVSGVNLCVIARRSLGPKSFSIR